MSATVCPINPPGHDWQNGLTCRWCRTTRTVTEAILSQLSSRRGGNPASAQKLLDAYRGEVLTQAKVETVAWLVKKAREYRATGSSQHVFQAEAIEFLASKADRGAVRAFLGTAHYRDAMDAHRAEVLAADGQAYDGELAMLRGLVGTLRVVAEHGDLTEVRRLLDEHKSDEQDAYTAVPSNAPDTNRRAHLLNAITAGGRWKPGTVTRWYKTNGYTSCDVHTARQDLAVLRESGAIVQHDEKGVRYFTAQGGGDRG